MAAVKVSSTVTSTGIRQSEFRFIFLNPTPVGISRTSICYQRHYPLHYMHCACDYFAPALPRCLFIKAICLMRPSIAAVSPPPALSPPLPARGAAVGPGVARSAGQSTSAPARAGVVIAWAASSYPLRRIGPVSTWPTQASGSTALPAQSADSDKSPSEHTVPSHALSARWPTRASPSPASSVTAASPPGLTPP